MGGHGVGLWGDRGATGSSRHRVVDGLQCRGTPPNPAWYSAVPKVYGPQITAFLVRDVDVAEYLSGVQCCRGYYGTWLGLSGCFQCLQLVIHVPPTAPCRIDLSVLPYDWPEHRICMAF